MVGLVVLDHSVYILHIYVQFERRHINLTMFGTFGKEGEYTAMAQGVGKPAAIAAKMILNGKVMDVHNYVMDGG